MNVLIAIFSVLIISNSASAIDCKNPQTTYEMHICAMERFEDEKVRLETSRQRLNQCLDIAGKEKLAEAQKKWEKFRKADCILEGHAAAGGSLEKILVMNCFGAITKSRANVLMERALYCEQL